MLGSGDHSGWGHLQVQAAAGRLPWLQQRLPPAPPPPAWLLPLHAQTPISAEACWCHLALVECMQHKAADELSPAAGSLQQPGVQAGGGGGSRSNAGCCKGAKHGQGHTSSGPGLQMQWPGLPHMQGREPVGWQGGLQPAQQLAQLKQAAGRAQLGIPVVPLVRLLLVQRQRPPDLPQLRLRASLA